MVSFGYINVFFCKCWIAFQEAKQRKIDVRRQLSGITIILVNSNEVEDKHPKLSLRNIMTTQNGSLSLETLVHACSFPPRLRPPNPYIHNEYRAYCIGGPTLTGASAMQHIQHLSQTATRLLCWIGICHEYKMAMYILSSVGFKLLHKQRCWFNVWEYDTDRTGVFYTDWLHQECGSVMLALWCCV